MGGNLSRTIFFFLSSKFSKIFKALSDSSLFKIFAIDSVESGVRVAESDSDIRTVGYGGYTDQDGNVTLDASIMDHLGNAGSVAYQTSKGGLVQMTRYMATEYGEYNIRVNCIAPFMVDTSMLDVSRQELDVNMEDEKKLGALNRVAKPIEIANSVLFLAEEKSSYITGTVLTIDAGFTSTRVLRK